MYPVELECRARLADGSVASIRPITPGDAAALEAFHDQLSSETVYRRFFAAHPHLQAKEVERYTHVDYRARLALVAEIDGTLSAVGRYDREPGTQRAEVAFVVADAVQGHGVGALLLEHLAAAARRRGVASFVAQTLGTNYAMQHVFRHAGFNCVERWVDGVIEVSFPIAPTQRYLEAVIQREAHSVRAGLGELPRAGDGGLGLVARTEADAEALVSACQSASLDVSTVLVTDGLGIDATDALLYLASDLDCEVLTLGFVDPIRPRRFVAVAREAARDRPVLSVVPAGGAGARVEQAGVEGVHRTEDLVTRGATLLSQHRGRTWSPPLRGQLIDLPGCDLGRARAALDLASPVASGFPTAPQPLPSEVAEQVLAAYGISGVPELARTSKTGGYLTVEDHPTLGLVGSGRSRLTGPDRALTRLLPLTDRDAEELVKAAGLQGARADAAVELVLRAARLIDDQPDIARVQLVPPRSSSDEARVAMAVGTGRDRRTDDDPFVRRLPASAAVLTTDEEALHRRKTG